MLKIMIDSFWQKNAAEYIILENALSAHTAYTNETNLAETFW